MMDKRQVEPMTAAEYRWLIGGTPLTPLGRRYLAALAEARALTPEAP